MPKNCLNDKKGRTTMEMLNQKNLSSLVFSESRLNKELKNIKWNRPLAKVNLRASNSVFLQLNSFLNQIVFVYSYSVLLISENA